MASEQLRDVQFLLGFRKYHHLSIRDLLSDAARAVKLTYHLDGNNLLGDVVGSFPYCPKGSCPKLF
jgi:hypothetical protein